jgi:CheY-like chemotaxis protein
MVTVLVVDDEEPIRLLLQRILAQRDLSVICASSATEALAICAEHHVDVLLTDINMPGMNGVDLADRVTRQYPAIAVLLMTGYAGTDVHTEHSVLHKPFTPQNVLNRVLAVVNRHPAVHR